MTDHAHALHNSTSLNTTAFSATLHCLTGCAIGEVLGMIVGTALGWSSAATIGLSVLLAFAFGFGLTTLPLLRAGLALGVALPLAFASDSFSIAVMELADNGVMLAVPGAMDAGLANGLFWGALALALLVAFAFAFPLNRFLIERGSGHAVVHAHHAAGADGRSAASAPALAGRFVLIGLVAIVFTLVVTVGAARLVESGEGSDPQASAGDAAADISRGTVIPARHVG